MRIGRVTVLSSWIVGVQLACSGATGCEGSNGGDVRQAWGTEGTVAVEERLELGQPREPERLPGDLPVTHTYLASFEWRTMTPCEFLALEGGTVGRYEVGEMFSRRVDRGHGAPTTVTFARLDAAEGGRGPGIWIVYDGGALSESRSVTADVGLEIGDTVYAVLSAEQWRSEWGAYDVGPANIFVEKAPLLLQTAAGRISIMDDGLTSVRAGRDVAGLDVCPLSWVVSAPAVVGSEGVTGGQQGWVTLQPDEGDGDDGAIHLPEVEPKEILDEPTHAE